MGSSLRPHFIKLPSWRVNGRIFVSLLFMPVVACFSSFPWALNAPYHHPQIPEIRLNHQINPAEELSDCLWGKLFIGLFVFFHELGIRLTCFDFMSGFIPPFKLHFRSFSSFWIPIEFLWYITFKNAFFFLCWKGSWVKRLSTPFNPKRIEGEWNYVKIQLSPLWLFWSFSGWFHGTRGGEKYTIILANYTHESWSPHPMHQVTWCEKGKNN